jgi:elongation factor G
MGDINSRRGKILGIESDKNIKKIKALVPQAEMFNYSKDLRSIARGRGSFYMKLSHYEEVPPHIQEKIIEESKKEKE